MDGLDDLDAGWGRRGRGYGDRRHLEDAVVKGGGGHSEAGWSPLCHQLHSSLVALAQVRTSHSSDVGASQIESRGAKPHFRNRKTNRELFTKPRPLLLPGTSLKWISQRCLIIEMSEVSFTGATVERFMNARKK